MNSDQIPTAIAVSVDPVEPMPVPLKSPDKPTAPTTIPVPLDPIRPKPEQPKTTDKPTIPTTISSRNRYRIAAAVVVVGAIASGVFFGMKNKKVTPVPSTTLEDILEREYLTCGVTNQIGFATTDENGQVVGFEADLCRAVAAGIFGRERFLDGSKREPVHFVFLEANERFSSLNRRDVDLLFAMTSQTIERSLFESSTRTGYTFSTPYLVTGLSFVAKPDYLPCVMSANVTQDDGFIAANFTMDADFCTDAKVCVLDGSTHQEEIERLLVPNFPGSIVTTLTLEDYYENFKSGDCNLLAGEQFDLLKQVLEANLYLGPYELGQNVFSKELISIVTRDNDPKFSDFVNFILQSLMTAEELSLAASAQISSSDLGTTDLFGSKFREMSQDAHAVVGDFGDLYDKHLEGLVPRSQANHLNLGSTPAMIVKPLGNLEISSPPPDRIMSPTIEAIQKRGFLNVGVSDSQLFSRLEGDEYVGFDIDFARAVAAVLFDGVVNVNYKRLNAEERFIALRNGDVDMLARRTTTTPQRVVNEPTTGDGFSFSSPTFHDSTGFVGESTYVQCLENRDWHSSECSDLRVCVTEGTTQYSILSQQFPHLNLVVSDAPEETVESFGRGDCQVFTSGIDRRTETTIRKYYSGSYVVGSKVYSRESLALVTNKDDVIFSKLVDLVVQSILYAEENGINQENYHQMPRVDLLRPGISDNLMRNAIRAVGNYEEIWNRHAGSQGLEREGRNLLNKVPLGPALMNDQTWDRSPP